MDTLTRLAYSHLMRTAISVDHIDPSTETPILKHPKIKHLLGHFARVGWEPVDVKKVKYRTYNEPIRPLMVVRPVWETTFAVTLRNKEGVEDTWTIKESLQHFFDGDMPKNRQFVTQGNNHSFQFDYGPILTREFGI